MTLMIKTAAELSTAAITLIFKIQFYEMFIYATPDFFFFFNHVIDVSQCATFIYYKRQHIKELILFRFHIQNSFEILLLHTLDCMFL